MGSNKNLYDLQKFYNNIITKNPLRYGHQFTVEFNGADLARYAAGLNIQADPTRCITYYVRSSEIPEVTVNSAKVSYFSAGFEVPGVVKYPDSWNVTILLDQDMTMYNILRNWQEALSSYRLSGGGIKTIPNIIARVNLLDRTMRQVVKSYIMEGVWINQLGNVDMQYQEGSSDAKTCSCAFAMQYFYEAGVRRSFSIRKKIIYKDNNYD